MSAGAEVRRDDYVGSAVCATCHSDIALGYAKTAMAQTSGPATTVPAHATIHNSPSNLDYRVYDEDGQAFFSYERASGDAAMHGRQRLDYFIGSGHRGRSYLFAIEGFLFQAPVSYYAQANRWDVSPGDGAKREMPANRAIEPSCLSCHATLVRPVAGTQNQYAARAFDENGVGCERCHGPGGAHVSDRAPMVNPATLPADRRDSVCTQCHLTGEARIDRVGRRFDDFRPGDRIADYVSYFVNAPNGNETIRAVGHVQALDESVCRQKSGDRMSCLSCHDPHVSPPTTDRAEYFRARCLACHERPDAPEADRRHFASNFDCVSCHMPKSDSTDVDHTAVTDHRILRTPSVRSTSTPSRSQTLRQLGGDSVDDRDLGLAYAEVARRVDDPVAAAKAYRLLATILPSHLKDAAVLSALAYLTQRRGDLDRAVELYTSALREDPTLVVAAVNLGAIYAGRGKYGDALGLWQGAFGRSPGLSEAGVDLAVARYATGDVAGARSALARVLEFNPDFGVAKSLLRKIDAAAAKQSRGK